VMASRLVKPDSASATAGDPVLVDGAHTGAGTTSISSTTVDAAVAADGAGFGVKGSSVDGTGVRGASSDDVPVAAFNVAGNRSGVIGVAGDPGTPGNADAIALNTGETGVYGFAAISPNSVGVWGDSDSSGTGVVGSGGYGVFGAGYYGVYGIGQVGVQASAGSTSQIALNVTGKAKFSRSGRTYVATGTYVRRINMTGVTTASYVIATLQTRRIGVYVHAVVPAAGYFLIYLNKAVTANTWVGYLVIN